MEVMNAFKQRPRKRKQDDPSSSSSPSSSSPSSSSSEESDSDGDTRVKKEKEKKRHAKREGRRSRSSSSTASAKLPVGDNDVAEWSNQCNFTLDDYVKMYAATPSKMKGPCLHPTCSILCMDHAKAATGEITAKLPPSSEFPKYKDPANPQMREAGEFIALLTRKLNLHNVHESRRAAVLVSCLPDRIMQEQVERDLIPKAPTYIQLAKLFVAEYGDKNKKDKLQEQLDACVQYKHESAQQYYERWMSIALRLYGDLVQTDTADHILLLERGYVRALRTQLAMYRAMNGKQEFSSIIELSKAAVQLERGLHPRKGKASEKDDDVVLPSKPTRQRIYRRLQPRIDKNEMVQGQPVNVNKNASPRSIETTKGSNSE